MLGGSEHSGDGAGIAVQVPLDLRAIEDPPPLRVAQSLKQFRGPSLLYWGPLPIVGNTEAVLQGASVLVAPAVCRRMGNQSEVGQLIAHGFKAHPEVVR